MYQLHFYDCDTTPTDNLKEGFILFLIVSDNDHLVPPTISRTLWKQRSIAEQTHLVDRKQRKEKSQDSMYPRDTTPVNHFLSPKALSSIFHHCLIKSRQSKSIKRLSCWLAQSSQCLNISGDSLTDTRGVLFQSLWCSLI